jgi:hypothetical protein
MANEGEIGMEALEKMLNGEDAPNGAPADGAVTEDAGAQAPGADGAPPAAAGDEPKAPLFKGVAKTINKIEDLVAYAGELERKAIEAEAAVATRAPAPSSPQEPKVPYSERLFTDPDAVIAEIQEETYARVEKERQRKEDERSFWTEFYDTNPDLRGYEDAVNWELNAQRPTYDALVVEKAKSLLASNARTRLSKFRTYGTPVTSLPNGPAITAGASGAIVRRVEPAHQPASFLDQVKMLQSKRKRS